MYKEEKEKFLDQYLEDHGYEAWDLLITVVEQIEKDVINRLGLDVQAFFPNADSGFLLPMYKMFGEMVVCHGDLVMQYLPKGETQYEDSYVGGLR